MKYLHAAATILAWSLVGEARSADVTQHIKTIKAVGAEGNGNTAARAAAAQLSASDAAELPTILAAFDGAGPLAANWLRASVDTIAERQLRSGGKLPASELEKFALDTKHAPRARRLAYEWLCRADATAADRLIPQMLNDPGLEFRRDAVARLLTAAEAADAEGKKEDAAKTFRQALSGARDLDQVQQIVKKLDSYGEKIDVPAHFGYLLKWRLIGPFDNTAEQGIDVAYPPETAVDFAAEYPGKSGPVKWIEFASEDTYGKVDLNKALGKANSLTGYAAAEFQSDVARPVDVRLQSTNALKVWLNGELLGRFNVYHAGSSMDQYVGHGNLKPGRNVILVKILQNEQKESWAQDWDFQCRVCDVTGTAVLSRDRVARSETNLHR